MNMKLRNIPISEFHNISGGQNNYGSSLLISSGLINRISIKTI